MNRIKSRKMVAGEFPKGKYYLGDLCYVLTDDQWNELLEQCIDHKINQCYDGEFLVSGKKVFMVSTAYGDGSYYDGDNNRYAVDSGTIGLCPTSIISQEKLREMEGSELGHIMDFASDIFIKADNGFFEIENDMGRSQVVIDTAAEAEYEDDEDEYDSEDDYEDDNDECDI